MAGLREISALASEIGQTVAKAREAAPARGTGHDSSRMAAAVIDQDATPVSLTLEQGWANALDPAEIGPALLEAYQAAVEQHLSAWGDDLRRGGWQYDARELDERVAHRLAESEPEPEPEPPMATRTHPERSISQLVEDTLRELDTSHELATLPPPPPPAPAEAPATASVSIVGGRLEGVEVNPEWAERRPAAEINAALAHAVEVARLETPTAREASPSQSLADDLLGDVFAHLQQLRKVR